MNFILFYEYDEIHEMIPYVGSLPSLPLITKLVSVCVCVSMELAGAGFKFQTDSITDYQTIASPTP